MNEMQKSQVREQEIKTTELGQRVQSTQNDFDGLESKLATSKQQIEVWRNERHSLQSELELISEMESPNADLRKRAIDIEEEISNRQKWADGAKSGHQLLEHRISMANTSLTAARNGYSNHVTGVNSTLTHSEQQIIDSQSFIGLDFKTKKALSDKVGGISELRSMMKMV